MSGPGVPPPRLPRLLVVALVVVAAEAVALAVGAGTLVVEIALGRVQHVGPTVGIALTFLALAALLGAAARALVHRRRWGRAPLATWQLLQGSIGVTQFAAAPLVSVLLVAAAVVVLVGLFAPASMAATGGGGPGRTDGSAG